MQSMFGAGAAFALALAACTAPTNGDARSVFDQLLNHPESRSLGVVVAPGSEDHVFECYTKKIEAAGENIATVSATLKGFLNERDMQTLPEKEKAQTTLHLLLALSSITTCQGGLPTAGP